MAVAWRIVKATRAKNAFDGEGAKLYGGRWTAAGRPAVYVSDSIALATLELFVHLNDARPLSAYSLFEVIVPDDLITALDVARLPAHWSSFPAPGALQTIGTRWLDGMESAALRVPSAIVNAEFNYVLNPKHPDFVKITVGEAQPFEMDLRLL